MKLITLVFSLFTALASTSAMAQLSAPLPAGTGAGTHGADSPFPQIKDRNDVLPWSVLTDVKTKSEKNRLLPNFPASVVALNQKTQRIQGFMMPLEPGEKQKHFLLTSVPMTCGFCVPGGAEPDALMLAGPISASLRVPPERPFPTGKPDRGPPAVSLPPLGAT